MGAGMKGGTGAALAARASPPHAKCGRLLIALHCTECLETPACFICGARLCLHVTCACWDYV